ncbi:MAG TPA: DNA polymerase Y family protein [Polymorphobacter sp.]|nr:DNA polymerase Y family protein [Polymorphobacter sp.]
MTPAFTTRRYLALWFVYLPCERALSELLPPAAPPETPFALVVRAGNALRLSAVGAPAARAGLSVGMTLADARARCPALQTLPHDPAADAALLERLAAHMQRFTPMVATDPPDGLILDITGCAHLFGGETALAAQAVADAGLTTRHAFAAHAAAARALARHGTSDDVRNLPVTALELSVEALSGLRRAGLATLGDLARRPLAGLAARFGVEAVQRLRAILGEVSNPIAARQPVAAIGARARFAEPLAHTEAVLDVLEDLLVQTARQMEARALGGRRFVVTLERSDGARRRLVVETGLPVRDAAVVMRLLRERIDSLSDPLDPGFGFDSLALAVPRTQPLGAQQIALDSGHGASVGDDSVAALIDRLATRLGPANICQLRPRDTHIPEAAQQLVPATGAPQPAWPAAARRLRPLLLLDPPAAITTITSFPDGPPQRFRWRGRVHVVCHAEGPERIAPEWWRRADGHLPGQHGLTRDYYRVEDGEGRRFWLFRHGLYEERCDPVWYIHGLFA